MEGEFIEDKFTDKGKLYLNGLKYNGEIKLYETLGYRLSKFENFDFSKIEKDLYDRYKIFDFWYFQVI